MQETRVSVSVLRALAPAVCAQRSITPKHLTFRPVLCKPFRTCRKFRGIGPPRRAPDARSVRLARFFRANAVRDWVSRPFKLDEVDAMQQDVGPRSMVMS